MMQAAASAAAFGCAGGLAGWFVVPCLADALLKRAYRRAHAWWWDSLSAYRAFKSAHPQREPSPWAPGDEGALGIWKSQAEHAAQAGSLPRERVRALADAGCALDADDAVRSESEQEKRCSFRASLRQRFAGAAGCALAGIGICWCSSGWMTSVLLFLAAAAMAVAIACDIEARIVPLETCAAMALAGAGFQVLVGGFEGLAVGGAYALAITAVCIAVNRVFGRKGGAPIGYGDVRCMAALSLMCGAAVPVGIVSCYASAAAFSLAGIAAGRLSIKSGIPMAPFLALWMAGGAWACMRGLV